MAALPDYIDFLERDRLDAEDEKEARMEWIDNRERALLADDDVVLEELAGALADPRTRFQIAKYYRAGDRVQAMNVMHEWLPTFINERAEKDYQQARKEGRL
ncbi:hypothetical protein ACQKIE_00020 [Luteibacter sp. NPDC031894]|uniref:hypothetical protein n=1 Tax=Luteibacter sp. NPDC031894 TaxID=3390572 RepID=UPI003D08B81E